jgi:hypothetical protein
LTPPGVLSDKRPMNGVSGASSRAVCIIRIIIIGG